MSKIILMVLATVCGIIGYIIRLPKENLRKDKWNVVLGLGLVVLSLWGIFGVAYFIVINWN